MLEVTITVTRTLTNQQIDQQNSKFLLACPKLTPTPTMIRTGTRTPEEVDGAKVKAPTPAVVTAIAITIAETIKLQKFRSNEK